MIQTHKKGKNATRSNGRHQISAKAANSPLSNVVMELNKKFPDPAAGKFYKKYN